MACMWPNCSAASGSHGAGTPGSSSGPRIPSSPGAIKRSSYPCWSVARASCRTCPAIRTMRATCESGSNMCADLHACQPSSKTHCTFLAKKRVCSMRQNALLAVQADCLPEPRDVFSYLKVRPGHVQHHSHEPPRVYFTWQA